MSLGVCFAPRSLAWEAKPAFYAQDDQLRSLKLDPPPAVGSETDRQDMAAIKDWQVKRTAHQCARAAAEAGHTGYDAFFGAISPFVQPMPSEVAQFFRHVQDDTYLSVGFLKTKYDRPRPFAQDSSVHPCIPAPNEKGYSYPSGHAAVARVFALVLSDLAPERRAEFLARADEVALDRVIGGVHHPTDVEAAKQLGNEIYAEFLKNQTFHADLEMARRFLKR